MARFNISRTDGPEKRTAMSVVQTAVRSVLQWRPSRWRRHPRGRGHAQRTGRSGRGASQSRDHAPAGSAGTARVCPACQGLALRRAHAVGVMEHLKRWLTKARVYRCDTCGWRGWSPKHSRRVAVKGWPLDVVAPDFASLDAAFQLDPREADRRTQEFSE